MSPIKMLNKEVISTSDGIIAKRHVKGSAFMHLFQDKPYILQLFQTLHPEAEDVSTSKREKRMIRYGTKYFS